MKYVLGTVDPLSLPKVNINFEQETITQALDILNKAETKLDNIVQYDGGIEVGTILTKLDDEVPAKYLACDGLTIYENEYPALYRKLLLNDLNEDINPITFEADNCYPWLNQYWLKTNRESIIDKKWINVGQLPNPLNNNNIIITNKKLYMFSSGISTGVEGKIYSFDILNNGDLVFDQYLNISLDSIITKYGLFTVNQNMFLLGNTIYIMFASNQTTYSYVCSINIQPDGTLSETINILPMNNTVSNVFRLGDYLYTGGTKFSRYPLVFKENSDIYNAIDNPTIHLALGQAEIINDTNLTGKAYYGVAILKDSIYFIGGGTGATFTTGQTTIYKSEIIDGMIQSSTLYNIALPTAMITRNNSCFVTRNKIFIINALDNKIYSANILENDVITKFEFIMTLPFTGTNCSYAIIDKYIYAFGGGNIYRLYIGGKGLVNYFNYQSNAGLVTFEKTDTVIQPALNNPLSGDFSFSDITTVPELDTKEIVDIFNDESCLSYYPLNDNSFDLSGRYNGLDVNVDYIEDGHFNGSAKIGPNKFNGIKSNILNPVLPSNSNLSISMWAKVKEDVPFIPTANNWRQNLNAPSTITDITGWVQEGTLPVAVIQMMTFVTKDRVYACGGITTSTVQAIYTAPIDENGNLGSWVAAGSLPGALRLGSVIVTKNRVYLLGGYTTVGVSTVYTAPFTEDGILGAWSVGTSLPVALYGSSSLVLNGYAYLIGGYITASQTMIYRAKILDDGTLDTWTTYGNLPVGTHYAQVVRTGNKIYLIGGQSSTTVLTTTYSTTINSDGSLGTTWTAGTTLASATKLSKTIVTKNRVYLIGGGNTTSAYNNKCQSAPIDENGVIGTWTLGTTLPSVFGDHSIIVTKSKIYAFGGFITAVSNIIYSAPFADGWVTDNITYNAPIEANDQVFLAGLDSNTATVAGQRFILALMNGKFIVNRYNATSFNTASTVLFDNRWHHIVLTSELISGYVYYSLYIDGVFCERIKDTLTTLVLKNDLFITIGSGQLDGNYNFRNGYIENVRLYTKSLNLKEVQILFNEKIPAVNAASDNDLKLLLRGEYIREENEETSTLDIIDLYQDGSCLAYYKLDGDALDETEAFSGTLSNCEFNSVGQFGQSLKFDGTGTSRLSLPLIPDASGVSFWFYLEDEVNSATAAQGIGSLNLNNTYNCICLGIFASALTNETLSINWHNNDNTNHRSAYIQDNIPAGWNHVLFQWTGSTWEIYLNNTKRTVITYGTIALEPCQLNFGGRIYQTTTGDNFNSSIDQIRIFSRALDSSEVNTLYFENYDGVAVDNNRFIGTKYYAVEYDNADPSINQFHIKDNRDTVIEGVVCDSGEPWLHQHNIPRSYPSYFKPWALDDRYSNTPIVNKNLHFRMDPVYGNSLVFDGNNRSLTLNNTATKKAVSFWINDGSFTSYTWGTAGAKHSGSLFPFWKATSYTKSWTKYWSPSYGQIFGTKIEFQLGTWLKDSHRVVLYDNGVAFYDSGEHRVNGWKTVTIDYNWNENSNFTIYYWSNPNSGQNDWEYTETTLSYIKFYYVSMSSTRSDNIIGSLNKQDCFSIGNNTQFETAITETFALNQFEGPSNTILRKLYTTDTLKTGWNHVVIQYEENSSTGYQFYINNKKVNISLYSSNGDTSKLPYKPWTVIFGNNYIRGTTYFNGTIANIQLFDNPLNTTEINSLYNEYGDLRFTSTETLPENIGWGSAFVTKNRVYLAGGSNSTTASVDTTSNKTWTAVLNEDGSLGNWVAGPTLPTPIFVAKPLIIKDKVYLFAGRNGSTYLTTVYVADILEDGTISNWSVSTIGTLPYLCYEAEFIVIKNKVYVFGGQDGTNATYRNTSLVSFINEDGTLGKWVPGPNIPLSIRSFKMTIIKNRLYMFGGYDGTNVRTNSYYCIIDEFGNLGSWITAPSLVEAKSYPNMIVTQHKIFLIGGYNGSAMTDTIISTSIDVNGAIGSWSLSSIPFPAVHHGNYALFLNNNFSYILGGRIGTTWIDTNKIYKVELPGGKNDYSYDTYHTELVNDRLTWEKLSNELPEPHAWGSVFMTKNRVYVVGGSKSGANNTTVASNTVITTTIDENGVLGTTWTTSANFPINIYTSKSFITKNRVYVLVSHNGTANIKSIYSAVINNDGTIGTWVQETDLPGTIPHPMIITTKHRVYVYSGYNGTSYVHIGYTALINEDGTLGTWTTAPNLPVITYNGIMFTTNKRVYLLGGYNGSSQNSNIYVATIKDDGSLGYWSKVTSHSPLSFTSGKALVLNNKVFLFTGYSDKLAAYTPQCYVATINSDGVIGKFKLSKDNLFPMHGNGLFTTSNYVYALGLRESPNYSGTWYDSKSIYRAPLIGGKNDYLEDYYEVGSYSDNKLLTGVNGPACGCDGPTENFKSVYFNGQSYITVPYTDDYSFGNQDFTIECFVKLDSNQSIGRIINAWNTGYTTRAAWDLFVNDGNIINFMVSTNGTNIDAKLSSDRKLELYTWYNIVVTRQNNTYKLFIDGILLDEITTPTALTLLTPNTLTIGSRIYTSTYMEFFNGFVANVRLSKGTAKYTDEFEVTEQPLTIEDKVVFLANFDNGGIADTLKNYNLGSSGQMQLNTFNSKFNKGCLVFDGQTDYLTTGYKLEDNFTISLWVNINNIAATLGYLGTYLDNTMGWFLTHTNGSGLIANGRLVFGCGGGGVTGTWVTVKDTLIPKQWTHITITKKGYLATDLEIYINGIKSTYLRNQGANLFSSPLPLKIGVGQNAYFSGSMDQIRIYERVLLDEEIMYLAHEQEPIINGQYKTGLTIPEVKYGIIKAEEG